MEDETIAQADRPKHGIAIEAILKSMGVEQYDAAIIPQLIEFQYRYTKEVLEEAPYYAEHAGRKELNLDDVRLAIQSRVNFSFTQPPPREFFMELAGNKNEIPLPEAPARIGVHLPAREHCLHEPCFQIESNKSSSDMSLAPRDIQAVLGGGRHVVPPYTGRSSNTGKRIVRRGETSSKFQFDSETIPKSTAHTGTYKWDAGV